MDDSLFKKLKSKIIQLLTDSEDWDEIAFQGPHQVLFYKDKRWETATCELFTDGEELFNFCFYLAQRSRVRLDERQAFQGGIFSSGFRWHAVIPPITKQQVCCLQVRKQNWSEYQSAPLSSKELEVIEGAMRANTPIVIYGPTGSGKSTFLYRILFQHCLHERLALIETLPELPCPSNLWISLSCQNQDYEGKGQVTCGDLLAQALRLRPDRIIVGEIREEETKTFIQTCHSGHLSCMTTMHASCTDSAVLRLESEAAGLKIKKALFIGLSSQNFNERTFTFYGQKLS